MKKLADYTIPFVGLKLGKHQYEYGINKEFFEHFEYDEFNDANVKIDLLFEKKTTMMELTFRATGTVNVNCDLTNEPYDQPIDSELFLVVKFGEEFNDDNEDLLILPHGEYEINVQQYIYELIVLSVPLKRVHPGVEDGSLESEVLDKLEELSTEHNENEDEIDPRWDKLKNLLND
ncbi:YceD family protein [Salegentibacter chungangensis]|uniref:YceD family protein n=1 Tax=Salegentibacter chungangensis TaxID=1335724 RepID=A0ABW3NLN1_9FLAO